MPTVLAVVGDIHARWDDHDNALFDASDVDGVLVVGDLAGLRFGPARDVAARIARLSKRVVLVPGNHDASHAVQLLGEAIARPGLGRPFVGTQARNLAALREATAPQELGAYSLHPFGDVTVIAGRPHSMGGPSLAFAPHLTAIWGVSDLAASAERLCALVDACVTERVVFVAHNGPTGLGPTPSDIWGCDFKKDGGDWGDPDLERGVAYARERGKRVLAVVAGHMHRRIRGGGRRAWKVERDGTLYVNAAEVPRIDRDGRHHHVRLVLDGDTATATDVWETP
ncbi:MAG: metallophosphoesterase [Alphaproteobacteria bacterium]|nr:metallophosphoesterase [Alphaproteobacteria bacterium]MCB9693549.1 metallophosphoesterase [Alphaproteobacteria bacterium]